MRFNLRFDIVIPVLVYVITGDDMLARLWFGAFNLKMC